MKKIFRIACQILAITMLLSSLTVLVAPISAQAESPDAEYEAKKAAYREKLMNDDVTSDNFLIGSWVSFYSFECLPRIRFLSRVYLLIGIDQAFHGVLFQVVVIFRTLLWFVMIILLITHIVQLILIRNINLCNLSVCFNFNGSINLL